MHTPLAHVLQERITGIEEALLQIEQHTDAETGLHNIEAHLLNLLELIESKPGVTAAADDLLQAQGPLGWFTIQHEPACSEKPSTAFRSDWPPLA
jgi:hypothetical protein